MITMDDDALHAAVDLVGRSGAREFDELRFGIGGLVDQRVPRLPDPPADRPLCASWGRPPGGSS